MMRHLTLVLLLLSLSVLQSQEKKGRTFFTGNVNFVLGLNENYVLFQPDDGESLINPTGVFVRFGFGYEFKRRLAISFNSGFDYHWNYAISAIPLFGSIKYNIWELADDAFFVDLSYGKMSRASKNYADGNYYGLGVGYQIAGENRWNTVFRLDFHRKAIFGFENNRIDNISLGIGFSFF
ncbi:MAG: hypothetical protein HWD82_03885 [Flavobacteriaceae bacterium]|nr:hypothetical protein [Flavobacteriaceae bacterium]